MPLPPPPSFLHIDMSLKRKKGTAFFIFCQIEITDSDRLVTPLPCEVGQQAPSGNLIAFVTFDYICNTVYERKCVYEIRVKS